MNLLATLLGMAVIDRLGRKTLLLIGSVGLAISLFGVSVVFFTHTHQSALLYLLVIYILFFAISQGAVIWVYISEVFPNRVRAKGQSLGSSGTFPLLAAKSGGYPFYSWVDGGLSVPGGIVYLSRDQKNYSRRNAAEVRD
jgi:MFS family permease